MCVCTPATTKMGKVHPQKNCSYFCLYVAIWYVYHCPLTSLEWLDISSFDRLLACVCFMVCCLYMHILCFAIDSSPYMPQLQFIAARSPQSLFYRPCRPNTQLLGRKTRIENVSTMVRPTPLPTRRRNVVRTGPPSAWEFTTPTATTKATSTCARLDILSDILVVTAPTPPRVCVFLHVTL